MKFRRCPFLIFGVFSFDSFGNLRSRRILLPMAPSKEEILSRFFSSITKVKWRSVLSQLSPVLLFKQRQALHQWIGGIFRQDLVRQFRQRLPPQQWKFRGVRWTRHRVPQAQTAGLYVVCRESERPGNGKAQSFFSSKRPTWIPEICMFSITGRFSLQRHEFVNIGPSPSESVLEVRNVLQPLG